MLDVGCWMLDVGCWLFPFPMSGAAPDGASCNRANARRGQPREGRDLCRSRPFRSFSSSLRSDIGFAEQFSGSVDRLSPSLSPLLRRGEREKTLRRSRFPHSVVSYELVSSKRNTGNLMSRLTAVWVPLHLLRFTTHPPG